MSEPTIAEVGSSWVTRAGALVPAVCYDRLVRQLIANAEFAAEQPWSLAQDECLYSTYKTLLPLARRRDGTVLAALWEFSTTAYICAPMWRGLLAEADNPTGPWNDELPPEEAQ